MKPPKTPAQQPIPLKLWHSINVLTGGVTFIVGSILLFPKIDDTVIINQISVWFYIVGSLALLFSDITELLHSVTNWQYLFVTINSSFNVASTFLYLVGSVLLLPQVKLTLIGLNLFIVGSFLLTASQLWRIYTIFRQSKFGTKQVCNDNITRITMLVISALGGVQFIIGTYAFIVAGIQTYLVRLGTWLFVIGSVFFFIPGLYITYLYFGSKKREEKLLISQQM